MQDRFDYATLFELLERLRRSHRITRFADLAAAAPGDRLVLLRHDVDYSPQAALRLAGLEAERSIAATYFVLPNSLYYNLLDPEHASFPRRLVELGHEVGLHYDVRFLDAFPQERREEWLETQARLLGALAGREVTSVAMHQPALWGRDPFRGATRYANAYDPRYFEEMTYLSDSCRAWRDGAWKALGPGPLPDRVQLVIHPINWGDTDRDRRTIFEGVHLQLAGRIERAGSELLAAIERHAGVLEHEARAARADGSR